MLFNLAESHWAALPGAQSIDAAGANVETLLERYPAITADHQKQAAPLSNFFWALATLANAAENSRHCGP
jgi:hypothetical protein